MESHGGEGWFTPAEIEWHSSSGGKPPFLTCKFSTLPANFLCEFLHLWRWLIRAWSIRTRHGHLEQTQVH